jgi:RHS repeat-associated protein
MIGRVLDDGSSQIYRYEYNSRGGIARYADAVGRETVFEYASNEIDLLTISQKNGLKYDLLQEMTYNAAHQRLAVTDDAGQVTTHTYNAAGQLLTVVTPPRAGITENRTASFVYDSDGYLEAGSGPATGFTKTHTYDSYGRVRIVTDSDNYNFTFDYDDLDRRTKITYADGTYEEVEYERLDPLRARDRLGRWTHFVFDSLRRLTTTADPLAQTVVQQWCPCGTLNGLVDANGNRTTWEWDTQGRVTKEIWANGNQWQYGYEDATSRLETVTDAKGQIKTYSYSVDNELQGVAYTNEEHETPNVSFTHDAVFKRIASMVDGTGTTTYSYHSVGRTPSLGAGSLDTVDGPLSNDTIAYDYDELGRVKSRAINGVTETYDYDALGRLANESNVLGQFSYQYDGAASRLRTVTYPSGLTSTYAYYASSGDNRLQEIHHRNSNGDTFSKFNYTYNQSGNIETWTQQQDANPAKAYDLEYDRVDQLRTAVWRTTETTPTILKRLAYNYDSAGNRTVQQVDNAPVLGAYDITNRLTSQTPGGTMRFAGTLSEAATVMIQAASASVDSDYEFAGDAEVNSGTNQVVVKAMDYSGNERTNTYEVNVSGSAKTFTFDANGNVTGDGSRTFEWDAENRLLAINSGIRRIEFAYDGRGRRVRTIEKENSITVADKRYVWSQMHRVEERDSGGSNVLQRYFRTGVQDGGSAYFYLRDHLGSVRELVDQSETVRARYDYEPYGNATKVMGDRESPFRFAKLFYESFVEQELALFRAYDTESGRWLSPDPIGLKGGLNLYAYSENNVVNVSDPTGLKPDGTDWCGSTWNDPAITIPRPGPGTCDPEQVKEAIRNVRRQKEYFCGWQQRGDPEPGPTDPTQHKGGNEGGSSWYTPSGDSCVDYGICVHEKNHIDEVRRDPNKANHEYDCEAYKAQQSYLEGCL